MFIQGLKFLIVMLVLFVLEWGFLFVYFNAFYKKSPSNTVAMLLKFFSFKAKNIPCMCVCLIHIGLFHKFLCALLIVLWYFHIHF